MQSAATTEMTMAATMPAAEWQEEVPTGVRGNLLALRELAVPVGRAY